MCHFHKHSELEITSLIDKSTINVPFSIAMLNYQRVISFRSPNDFHPPVDWGFVVWPWWTRSNLRPRRFQTLAAKTKRRDDYVCVAFLNETHTHHYNSLYTSGWWFEPSWPIWKSMRRMTSHIWNGKQHVPNHQPGTVIYIYIAIAIAIAIYI